jgi:oligoribonuclease
MRRHAKYLFLDLETTGLDPARCSILECAAVVVDSGLVVLEETEMGLHFDLDQHDMIDPVVVEMHTANELWSDCEQIADDVDTLVCVLDGVIDRYEWDEGKPILAGSSIHFDRSFLQVHAPAIVTRLHYRMLDVSSLKMLRRDAGAPDMPKGDEPHRALPDALYSLAQARQIRDEMHEGRGWTR